MGAAKRARKHNISYNTKLKDNLRIEKKYCNVEFEARRLIMI